MRRLTSTILVVLVILGLLISDDVRAFTSLPSGFTDVPITDVPVPTAIAWLPDADQTLLVTSQSGRLFRWTSGTGLQPALDLTSTTCSNGEMGLLGVAVDPNFSTGQRFIYLYYTHKQGPGCAAAADRANRVSRFTLDGSNNAGNELVLIDHIPAPGTNHNAGDLHFGLDGLLYISVGDGGSDLQTGGGGALNGNARRLDLLNGKILRITPDGGIPAGNPFQGAGTTQCAATGQAQSRSHRAGSHGEAKAKGKHGHKHKQKHHRKQKRLHRHKRRDQNENPPPQDHPTPDPGPSGSVCQEIFATGLRNPFRFAFDPDDSKGPQRFFINDVGQGSWEEIDDGQAGADYGWNIREGPCPTGTTTGCSPDGRFSEPDYAYDRTAGCVTITGGAIVPNSNNWPDSFDDVYLFADFGCGSIFILRNQAVGEPLDVFGSGTPATSLAFGPDGNLYYTSFTGGGHVGMICYTPPPP